MKRTMIILLLVINSALLFANRITNYEYWIDSDYSNKVSGVINPPVESLAFSINPDLSSIQPGVHYLNIRFKDSLGKWSIMKSSIFYQPHPLPNYQGLSYSSNKIYGYRWWFDFDKNTIFEVKLKIPVDKYSALLNLQCPKLDTIGKHSINIQFLDSANKWSIAKSDTFFFDGFILPKPLLSYPTDNGKCNKDSVIEWELIPYTNCQLQISKNDNFSELVVDTNNLLISTFKLNLDYQTRYYWRVKAFYNGIASEWSEIWQFTTNGKATINTPNLSKLLSKSFVSGGNIISDGGYPITSKGICYNLTGNPTTDDFITNNGTGSASFTSYISGLTPNTNYFVRAYATNEAGTAYGNELNFKTAKIDIPLGSGWNLISSNYKHSEPDSMQYIWAHNTDKLVITKNNAGSVYIPQFGINSIGKWDVTQGYQVYMSAADTLGITGEHVVPAETGIALKSGWNMIAYLRNSSMEAPLAFASITDNGNLVIAKNISGQVYIPSFGINSIGNLVPGQGYRVYVTNHDTLFYPDN